MPHMMVKKTVKKKNGVSVFFIYQRVKKNVWINMLQKKRLCLSYTNQLQIPKKWKNMEPNNQCTKENELKPEFVILTAAKFNCNATNSQAIICKERGQNIYSNSMMINANSSSNLQECLETNRVFRSMIAVAFQSVFYLEMLHNNIFLFLLSLHQNAPKTLKKLIWSKRKIQILLKLRSRQPQTGSLNIKA